MRSAILLAGAFVLFGFGAHQATLPAPLAKDYDKLSSAPSLTVEFKMSSPGTPRLDYQLMLGKPNMFKLTYDDGFIQSDGQNIYTYKKADNTYTQVPVSDDSLADVAGRPEMFGWAPYFVKDAATLIAGAKVVGPKPVSGNDTTEVNVIMKKAPVTATMYLDKMLDVPRGYDLKTGSNEYLVIASKIEVGKEKMADSMFAFSAPSGAKMVALTASTDATYANVQKLMTANCMPCHNAQNRRSNVDLSNYAGIAANTTPGDGKNSILVKVLVAPGAARMPAGGRPPLSKDEIAMITKWIDDGAKK